MTYEGLRLAIRRKYMKITVPGRRKKIENEDFTIISNNCWGGFIYQSYGLKYNSPTIGCFFMAEDYLKFISNIKKYLEMELKFIDPMNSHSYEIIKNKAKFGKYPIGVLEDIEIHFLHYKSKEEAKEKWYRRVKRVNYNKILYKFSNQNNCTDSLIEKFSKMPLDNKICFTSKKYNFEDTVYIKAAKNQKEIKASYEPFGKSKYIDINNLINELYNLGE